MDGLASGFWLLSPNQQPEDHPEKTDPSKQRKGRTPSHDDDQEGEKWRKDCWPNGAAKGDNGQTKCPTISRQPGRSSGNRRPIRWSLPCSQHNAGEKQRGEGEDEQRGDLDNGPARCKQRQDFFRP